MIRCIECGKIVETTSLVNLSPCCNAFLVDVFQVKQCSCEKCENEADPKSPWGLKCTKHAEEKRGKL